MEIAGFALNILPLMVSVAENYKKLFLIPLARYQNFSDEAAIYVLRLENQQAIFQTQCILLLSTVVDRPAASQMPETLYEQAETTKAEVEERLKSVLGGSHKALRKTIKAIEAVLETIQCDCKRLSEMVEKEYQGKKKNKFSDLKMFRSWKSHIRTKLKFSFSESHLSANLKTLTDLNQDFVTLSSFFQMSSKPDEKEPTHSHTGKIIDKHRLIGIAAEEVWQSLNRLESVECEEHWAHLGIGDERVNQDKTNSGSTKFNLALCCTGTSLDLSRFVVTIKLLEQDSPTRVESLAELAGALRSILKIEEGSAEMLEQGMADHVTIQPSNSAPCDGPSSARKTSRQDDHEEASDLCAFLKYPEFDRLSGSIQAFSAFDEGAKAPNPKAVCEGPRGVPRKITLNEVLETCSRDRPRNGLPVTERLRLAKFLSVAYFRFHSTGWANSGWNSKGICFQSSNKDDNFSDVKSLHMPYLQSRVYSTSSLGTSSLITSSVSQSSPTFGLSTTSIFNLGLLLLEIGFSRTLDTLGCVCPAQYNYNDRLSAGTQARTLLANGLFDMGRTYRKIVSKLIDNVYDLDDPGQEAAFLAAVVIPLEEVERKLEAFPGPLRIPV